MEYTITLTDAEKIAMEYIAIDVQEWISNAAKVRAEDSIKEIQTLLMDYCNKNNVLITVGKDAQVQQAFELGLLSRTTQSEA
jgi:hypothetical protein